ncbi:phage tail protein [Belliella aquatica]|uniref:Tail Collar domain-containing protein n=1 Tax=Belliella aquatica TaxID=1323734 RepID=A0ABQ1MZL5_9BACT|nr:tail fiber protein [Belliella aquatica]MCH7407452.1 tail fiber protein [Belliella aquatica]GGC49323.1 tail Collar domain-containing protein [Belliella aquatica]
MSATDPFVAEICMFPFNFAPRGWAWCDGQLLPISQNTALFALLGTTYGGDGRSTFALPNLQGRVLMHPGQGQGLSLHDLGEMGGQATVSLIQSEIPLHTHRVDVNIPAGGAADTDSPLNAYPATFVAGEQINGNPAELYSETTDGNMASFNSELSANPAGGGQPHNNMQPTLFVYYCIALQGVFPPRT